MRAEDFELLYKLEEKFWWFVAMRKITDTIVATELEKSDICVLDAGCGTGFNLGHYASGNSRDVYGLDVERHAIEWIRKRDFHKITQASVTDIPFKPGIFDLVFSFDVLQQLPEELNETAIREMHRVLKPGGVLFIRVAAYEWLRSSHDDDMSTPHRFMRSELVEKLTRGGFKVEWQSYANSLLMPVVILRRVLKGIGLGGGTDVRPLPRGLGWLDRIFREILESEAKWFKSGRRFPFGLSVICYARKMGS
jgi:SAM-dependent methyltransferase